MGNNLVSNEIQNYLNIPNSAFSSSYWIAKGLMSVKGGSILIPLMVLL
jgi:hypothetical protein